MRKTVAWLFTLHACVLCGGTTLAAEFPAKPIRLIVPIAPGGSNDLLARAIAQKLQDALGQPVVVDNRAGGGGTIGTELAARSAPDGYTVLMANISHAVNPALFAKLPYDSIRDFSAIGSIATSPNIVVAPVSAPFESIADLIRRAKARPNEISYASAGNGSSPHLAMELFKLQAGLEMVHVPYKGTGPALSALLAREVMLSFSTLPPALPHVKAGRLRALAISTARRSPIAPDLPTMQEAGVKNFDFSAWFGLLVPAGTPRSVVTRLNSETARAAGSPEMAAKFAGLGFDLSVSSPEQFQQQVRDETKKWANVVGKAGIRID